MSPYIDDDDDDGDQPWKWSDELIIKLFYGVVMITIFQKTSSAAVFMTSDASENK